MKSVALVAVPPGVVTAIGPVVAPVGTVAVIWVSEFTVNVVAAMPPNVTALAPVKPVPVITTEVPTAPLVGLNDVMVGTGDGVTSKLVALVPVPSVSVTAMAPSVALAGTVAVIWVSELTVNEVAAVPLKVTAVATLESWKPVPVITTDVPIGPLVGLNEVTVGAAANAAGTPSQKVVTPASAVATSTFGSIRLRSMCITPSLAQTCLHTLTGARQTPSSDEDQPGSSARMSPDVECRFSVLPFVAKGTITR